MKASSAIEVEALAVQEGLFVTGRKVEIDSEILQKEITLTKGVIGLFFHLYRIYLYWYRSLIVLGLFMSKEKHLELQNGLRPSSKGACVYQIGWTHPHLPCSISCVEMVISLYRSLEKRQWSNSNKSPLTCIQSQITFNRDSSQ